MWEKKIGTAETVCPVAFFFFSTGSQVWVFPGTFNVQVIPSQPPTTIRTASGTEFRWLPITAGKCTGAELELARVCCLVSLRTELATQR